MVMIVLSLLPILTLISHSKGANFEALGYVRKRGSVRYNWDEVKGK